MAEATKEQISQRARDLFNRGFSAFERGKLDIGIDLLSTCVQMEPAFLQARKFLRAAEIQKFKQAGGGAVQQWAAFARGVPALLGVTLSMMRGKGMEALGQAERLLRTAPLSARYTLVFADAATLAGLPEAAIQTLEVARDHYPANVAILKKLGGLYRKTGQTADARKCFEALCEISPHDPEAIKSLKDAMAEDSMKRDGWTEAAQTGDSFRRMIRDEKEAALIDQQAKAVRTDQDLDALIADALAKVESRPDNVNYYRELGRLYVQKKAYAEAVGILERAMETNPGDPELHAALSATRLQKLDYEIAELEGTGDAAGAQAKLAERAQFVYEDLMDRVKRYPNDLKLRYEWGVMLFEQGQINDAIQQFQIARKSPKHRIRSLYYLALCFKQKEQYDLALDQLQQALSETTTMDEARKDICYEVAEISAARGDMAKAADFYKQIYEVDIGYKDVAQKFEDAYRKKSG